ncbi:MAG: hypothetical protein M3O71_26375 [Bacteroidota bacterium]|nr:hypothetical protein [Bacteroidota bacterium]
MAGKCSHAGCPDPDNIGCNVEGHIKLTNCPYYDKGAESNASSEQVEEDLYRVPWTGNSLGLTDLNYLTASNKPILIGITGVASAGKTTFLASLYCLLRSGRQIGNYSFAGSLTLYGWEDIAWFLSWKDNSNIQFPPHTTNNSGRLPGLLHIALRNKQGEKIDIVLTDAPGEWFDHWRNNINSENAKGARWIHEYCNAFLLFADCEMLSGSKRGHAKMQINTVSDRICENIDGRPLALIWSKSDIAITDVTKEQILSHIGENQFEYFAEFQTSVHEGDGGKYHQSICNAIGWVIERVIGKKNLFAESTSLLPNDMFLSKRGVNG